MQSEIIELSDKIGRKAIITLTAEEVETAFQNAEFEVTKLMKRSLGTKQLGEDPKVAQGNAIATRATRQLAEESCKKVINTRKDRVVSSPKIDVVNLAERGKHFTFESLYEVVPEFELEGFEALRVDVPADLDVSSDDIERRLLAIQQRSAIERKDSCLGITGEDTILLSFESFIDGEAYEGSSGEHYTYQMGSNDLPQNFESGLMDMHAGEKKTIEFVVPKDFNNNAIAGKTARFDVEVKSITSRTLPKLTDDFADSFGYESLDDWRMKLREDILQEKKNLYEINCEKRAREVLAEHLRDDVPQEMVATQSYRLLEAFKQELTQQQIGFEQYCQYLNVTEESIRKEMEQNAEVMLKENLALESLFRSLNVEISDKELAKTIEIVSMEGNMPETLLLGNMTPDQINAMREMTMHRIATEWLLENVVFEDSTRQKST